MPQSRFTESIACDYNEAIYTILKTYRRLSICLMKLLFIPADRSNVKMARRVDVNKENLKAMGYDNLEHWLEDTHNVYVGRNVVYVAGAKRHEFANKFSVKKYGRCECLRKYGAWLIEATKDDEVRSRFEALRGKTLGCWCGADEECHADMIIRMLDKTDGYISVTVCIVQTTRLRSDANLRPCAP